MPKEEWGTKRICPETGKRFYDLNKSPIVSPYTGEVVAVESAGKSRTMVADKADASNKPKEDKVEETEDQVLDESDETADVDLGDDILDDADEKESDDISLDEIADVAANDDDD